MCEVSVWYHAELSPLVAPSSMLFVILYLYPICLLWLSILLRVGLCILHVPRRKHIRECGMECALFLCYLSKVFAHLNG